MALVVVTGISFFGVTGAIMNKKYHPQFPVVALGLLYTVFWLMTAPPLQALETIETLPLTPPVAAEPHINGPSVFGVRPGSPFLYSIPATGSRPMSFSVQNLPNGLSIDKEKGLITGEIKTPGEFKVTLLAGNSLGSASKNFRIIVGDHFALTPPMGWNSYNVYDQNITQEVALKAARAIKEAGLDQHGWTYVNMDDGWQGSREGSDRALQPDPSKFTNIKSMVDQIHAMGLKVGIYHTPWITSYGGMKVKGRAGATSDSPDGMWVDDHKQHRSFGKYSFVKADADQFGRWGFDYLKYDWNPISLKETEEMEEALSHSGRDIVFSLSNSMKYNDAGQISPHAQLWRTSGDITDTWGSLMWIGFRQLGWGKFLKPGHFNDPDMLCVGHVGWGHPRPTRLTPDEQYTHISLWCLLSAPLIMGCDLTQLDPFTIGLLTNDEVLAIDQDALCKAPICPDDKTPQKVYIKDMEDGTKAVGLFNTSDQPAKITLDWKKAGISGKQNLRDLWHQKDLGIVQDSFSAQVPIHGVLLLKVSPAS
jgi:alpha-galactosidase